MRVLWKGAISFGLVTIPVALYPATQREELKFKLLRRSDLSPINYKRVAEADGKEVPWEEIVKGYEYEKGRFIVLSEEDFARVDVEATQTVDIVNFVKLEEVNPLLFYKPYFLEVGKGGDKAYTLLRDALRKSGKIAIARVVIRAKEHLAAVKPQEGGLILELMHFPRNLVPLAEFKEPQGRAASKAEMQMAEELIKSMSTPWEPEAYVDEYKEAVEKMIDEKITRGEAASPAAPPSHAPKATKVVDLVAVLKQSLAESQQKPKKPARAANARKKTTHAKKGHTVKKAS